MLRRLLLGKGAGTTCALRSKPFATIFSSRGGGGFFSTSLPRLSSDSPQLTALFRSYGIGEDDTDVILGKLPSLGAASVEKTVRPKLDLLSSAGLTGDDISQILVANPQLLHRSLENAISSSVSFLKTTLPSKGDIVRFLKRCPPMSSLQPNIEVLKLRGVPGKWILKFLIYKPITFAASTERFLAAVRHVEDLGLSPNNGGPYLRALFVMSYMSRSTFLRKVEVYKQVGWPEHQVVTLIRKFPNAMTLSDDNIKKKMEFLRDKVGWGTEYISISPNLLGMSFEKRIVPRCAVLNLLISRGLIDKHLSSSLPFRYSNKRFLEKYVRKYESQVPDVVNAFYGHIAFQGWDWSKDDLNTTNTKSKEEEEKKKKPSNAPKS